MNVLRFIGVLLALGLGLGGHEAGAQTDTVHQFQRAYTISETDQIARLTYAAKATQNALTQQANTLLLAQQRTINARGPANRTAKH